MYITSQQLVTTRPSDAKKKRLPGIETLCCKGSLEGDLHQSRPEQQGGEDPTQGPQGPDGNLSYLPISMCNLLAGCFKHVLYVFLFPIIHGIILPID